MSDTRPGALLAARTSRLADLELLAPELVGVRVRQVEPQAERHGEREHDQRRRDRLGEP
jgi:hypothetical protein